MILIRRTPAPPGLTVKRAEWTARWISIRDKNSKQDWATDAAKQALREPLLTMSRGKCAYCEIPVNLEAPVQIEHFEPKTTQPQIAFAWDNLFPSCAFCNQRKRDIPPRTALKPDRDNGESFFRVDPEGRLEPRAGLSKEDEARALHTIGLLDLNRGTLCEARKTQLLEVKNFMKKAAMADKDDLLKLLKPSAAFKLVIRFGFAQAGAHQLAAKDRLIYDETA